jgi:hypothetical protein
MTGNHYGQYKMNLVLTFEITLDAPEDHVPQLDSRHLQLAHIAKYHVKATSKMFYFDNLEHDMI